MAKYRDFLLLHNRQIFSRKLTRLAEEMRVYKKEGRSFRNAVAVLVDHLDQSTIMITSSGRLSFRQLSIIGSNQLNKIFNVVTHMKKVNALLSMLWGTAHYMCGLPIF